MVEYKIDISQKSGTAQTFTVKEPESRTLLGLKVGAKVDASVVGLKGMVRITGGSDKAGFPMRSDVQGGVKAYVLLHKGKGFRSNEDGVRKRKLIRGNTITEEIYQVNGVLEE